MGTYVLHEHTFSCQGGSGEITGLRPGREETDGPVDRSRHNERIVLVAVLGLTASRYENRTCEAKEEDSGANEPSEGSPDHYGFESIGLSRERNGSLPRSTERLRESRQHRQIGVKGHAKS